jgi:DNA-directed RNA polymerase subunit K/omega
LDENFAISRTLKLDTKCPQNLLFTKKTNFNNLHLALERVFQKKVSFEITQDILTP